MSAEGPTRFPNAGVPVRGQLYWDVLGLWREVLHGLTLAAGHGPVASVGVNSWAVDYGLIDRDGELMGHVHHYRSPRLDGVMASVRARLSDRLIYDATGLQFLPFNTLYQLMAEPPGRLSQASRLLMVPDGGDLRAAAGEKYPTATLAEMTFAVTDWPSLAPGGATLTRFVRPRDLAAALRPEG